MMKKPILNSALILAIILLGQSTVFADQRFGDRIENREYKQSQRIEKGFNQGELTYRELKRLIKKKQLKFENLSYEFLRDDYYSPRERNILSRKYDKLDGMIYRMKHNKQRFHFDRSGVIRNGNKRGHGRYSYSHSS